jgi:hypothetical protein
MMDEVCSFERPVSLYWNTQHHNPEDRTRLLTYCLDHVFNEILRMLHVFLQDCTGIIDFREYLLGVLVISKASNAAEMVELAFKVTYHSEMFCGCMQRYDILELFSRKHKYTNI